MARVHRVFFLIAIAELLNAEVWPRTSYFSSDRVMKCVNYGVNVTRCSVKEEDRSVESNPGCFEEDDHNNSPRVYCRLNCEESDEATVLAKIPSSNHKCNNFFTYHLERRRRDWYLWRSGRCIHTTVTFQVRCGFPQDPRQFYTRYKELFEYDEGEIPLATDSRA